MKQNPWMGLAVLASMVAVVIWAILAIYSAAGEHISSTAEDVALAGAVIAGVVFIIAAIFNHAKPQLATTLAAAAVLVLAITYWFSPTTW